MRSRPSSSPRRRGLRRLGLAVALVVGLGVLSISDFAPAPRCLAAPPAAPPAPAFDAVVIGDTQQMPPVDWVVSGGPRERGRVRDRIRALDPDFVVLAGDAVCTGSWKPFWKQFRREWQGVPIWPVLGNHDLHGPNGPALRYYFETFPHVENRRWYVLRRPPVAFLMLDSNFANMGRAEEDAQQAWLEAELDRAQADPEIRAIALVTHHPPYSTHLGGGNRDVRERFWDAAARRGKFLVFFSGHHHAYQHIRVGRRHAFVTGGGGAPLSHWDGNRLPPGAELAAARASHHLLRMRAADDGLTMTMQELQTDGTWEAREAVTLPWPE